MHDILIDNHALSDLQGYLAVIVINNGRAFFHQKYLNFRMPVPANPVHIGTVQIHIGKREPDIQFPQGKAYALISLFCISSELLIIIKFPWLYFINYILSDLSEIFNLFLAYIYVTIVSI